MIQDYISYLVTDRDGYIVKDLSCSVNSSKQIVDIRGDK